MLRDIERGKRPRRIAARNTRDWRERLDTRHQGLRVAPVALDLSVARLRVLADFFSIMIKQNGPPLCGIPRLLSEQGDVQQSFSRSKPIAPRLRLPMNSI